MTAWLRRAGEGTMDGALVRWSVAEGSRGRRWRWTISRDGDLVAATLLELDTDGRFARLERETADGSLTAHPEPDGRTLHGNLVRAGGVDPLTAPWRSGYGLVIVGDPFGSALCRGSEAAIVVRPGGDATVATGSATADDEPRPLATDDRGVPRLAEAAEWPLEA